MVRDTRNLFHKFNSQGPAFRILDLRVATPKSQGPSSRVLGVRVSCRRVLEPQVPGLRVLNLSVLGSRVSGPQSPGSQDPGSRVSGPDFRLCRFQTRFFHKPEVALKIPC